MCLYDFIVTDGSSNDYTSDRCAKERAVSVVLSLFLWLQKYE